MSKNRTIADLRELLFETIEGVKNGKIDVNAAKCISDLSQVMVNSAKAEADYAKATGAMGSGFLESARVSAPDGALPSGITGITTHRLRG